MIRGITFSLILFLIGFPDIFLDKQKHGSFLDSRMLKEHDTCDYNVVLGIDVLVMDSFNLLRGKRVGLITNSASINYQEQTTYDLLRQGNVNLRAVFTPEHGFQVDKEAGEKVTDLHQKKHPAIYSLYGKRKAPTKEQLSDIDILVFDVFDVGVRVYTYISTMRLAMHASFKHNKRFMVLDRPNPIGFFPPQGFLLDTTLRSFVGNVQVPFIHSMTVGEIATLIKTTELPYLDLEVVKMEEYSRGVFFDQTGLPFSPPSPNIQSMESMICYPVTVLLEATNISEGRGTMNPFGLIGAPFLDPKKVISLIRKDMFEGFILIEESFVPRSIKGKSSFPKHKDRLCYGLRIVIDDREKVKPFEASVALLVALYKSHPKEFKITKPYFFDRLTGGYFFRNALLRGYPEQDIVKHALKSNANFKVIELY